MGSRIRPVFDRFIEKVEIHPSGCWLWTGALQRGHGVFRSEGSRMVKAHRWSYEFWKEPIPDGLIIDHQCHNESDCLGGECLHRRCVNPDHLVLSTHRENLLASKNTQNYKKSVQSHCIHGHEFTLENTYRRKSGGRGCKECGRIASREYQRHRRYNGMFDQGDPGTWGATG